ncbi:MAG: putative membrane protein [Sediminicola sp.]|jgi:putative membrane protein|tara:strand:+ start:501 stop:1388 length:888 start_codon:yes stop_codon:yes gene_type:complete
MILEKRIPIKYWFNIIKWDMLLVLLFSTGIYFLSKYLIDLNIPVSVGAFLGTAISLLLSFKLSQSYDRWWEARKIWGSIVNDSRTLVIQLKGFTQKKNKDITDLMAFRQIAWCYSLSQSLRNQNATDNLNEFISERELKSIQNQKNIPLALLDIQSQYLSILHKEKSINDYQQIQIDATLVKLCASMGMAERIKNTYFPKTYRLTLRLFIYIFLATLSFGLTEIYGLIEIPFIFLISIPLLLLEKIAYTIQDPFENKPSDTAMTSISRTIEINIKQQLGLNDIPEAISTDDYYIL